MGSPTSIFLLIGCNAEVKPEGEAADFIAFALASIFLLLFSAQKSHVKPRNDLTQTNKT
jgi:hypothetical protein